MLLGISNKRTQFSRDNSLRFLLNKLKTFDVITNKCEDLFDFLLINIDPRMFSLEVEVHSTH